MAKSSASEPIPAFDSYAEVGSLLGTPRAAGKRPVADAFADSIRKGLPSSAVVAFSKKTQISERTLVRLLTVPERTWRRKLAERQRLTPLQSDRLYRIAQMVARGTEVLGERARAVKWMTQENRALSGARPLDLLDTEIGEAQVRDVLGRIDYGLFS
jgi:putative toxin-antitoxin system antitoxin component (TIGR02293 family)